MGKLIEFISTWLGLGILVWDLTKFFLNKNVLMFIEVWMYFTMISHSYLIIIPENGLGDRRVMNEVQNLYYAYFSSLDTHKKKSKNLLKHLLKHWYKVPYEKIINDIQILD